jgi:glucose-1-phosphate adenylyltransferase
MKNVMMADGCRIMDSEISGSVIGLRSIIKSGVKIKDTYLMGADYYDLPNVMPRDGMPLGIGLGCDIEGAIIDKNVRMGREVVIRPFPLGTELDTDMYTVRDGIVVIPKSSTIPDKTYIGPERS